MFVLCSLLVSCAPSPTPDSQRRDSDLIVGLAEANVPDPELGIGQFVNLLSFESLTNNSLADGRVDARLAARWAWENDYRRLRVFLRPGIFLHDGRPFSGTTAVEIVRRTISSPGNLARYPSLRDVSTVSVDNELEILFDLARPSPMLPEDLTVPMNAGPDAVGTGPYQVVQRDDELVLQRFDRYHGGTPSIERVIVRPFEQLRTTWASLLRGEVDMVYDVPADAVEFILNDDVQVVRVPRWYQFSVVFNSSKRPFQSPLVRRALNVAIDRTSVVERVLRGHGAPSTGPVWPNYWAYDATVGSYSYNPAQAASLLDAAGLPPASVGGSPNAPPARFRFTCLIPENFSVWERIALELQKDLFDVGVDMQFEIVAFEEFNRRIGEGDFEAVFLDLISGPSPSRFSIFWRSARTFEGVYNVFGYENADAEQAFESLRYATNDAAMRTLTQRLQRVMLEDPPALFIAWNERARALRREFVLPEEANSDLIWTLHQWTRAPRQVASAP